jgi:hypothetical protein
MFIQQKQTTQFYFGIKETGYFLTGTAVAAVGISLNQAPKSPNTPEPTPLVQTIKTPETPETQASLGEFNAKKNIQHSLKSVGFGGKILSTTENPSGSITAFVDASDFPYDETRDITQLKIQKDLSISYPGNKVTVDLVHSPDGPRVIKIELPQLPERESGLQRTRRIIEGSNTPTKAPEIGGDRDEL